jgi:pimeloyl-ACP methyl ester carboxylesterase
MARARRSKISSDEAGTAPRSPLNVEVIGDGPDLVFLHGGAGGVRDLDALRERLAAGRRTISPDQRGHGRSPDPGDLSYAAMAADTAALLDELGVRGADVVGWSDGGVVGLLLARDRPDLVGRPVAISANAALASDPPALTVEAAEYLARMKPEDLEPPEGRAALAGVAAGWPATAERIVAMWRVGPDLTLSDLGRISSPVLYLAADGDIVPLEHTVAMHRATPGSCLAILEGADHRLPQHRVEDVAAIVERFLAR